ncbi:MAG: response regulator transcription factor [Flavobacteriales bacterium]|nr:response regulator transcription factor [Flavobacteriales bacterium]
MSSIKVSIYDDNPSRLEALRMLLDGMPGTECVGVFSDGRNAAQTVADKQPDVILMDIDMPYVDGIEAVKNIKSQHPEVKIIMQTVFEDERKIISAICAGADGYILKQASPVQLVDGIMEVMDGGAPMTPTIASRVLKIFSKTNIVPPSEENDLTKREKEILKLLVEGYSYKMIADKCFISYATVNTHVSHIYSKLQVNSVAGAVSKALKENLV